MALQRVKAVQDNDSHWYVIPEELENEFNRLVESSGYESCEYWEQNEEDFIDMFSKYMTGGDLNNTQLYADI